MAVTRRKRSAMDVIRIVPNVVSDAFAASREFYESMFDLTVSVELDDWYLQVMAESNPSLNLGFLAPKNDFTGGAPSPAPGSVVITIHVDDVVDAYRRAKHLEADIATTIRNEEYGQRHFVVVDPNGVVLNVMSAV
jgi:predicted enzyme related to lactoylglutathione lyase